MTWPMRTATMYYAPFRIRPRGKNDPEPDYGEWLTAKVATSDNGPLYANGPGDISRWMAVPWQTDTASCRAGYDPAYDPYLPTFWPVHVPNHVLTLENYEKAIDTSLPRGERLEAFNSRATWYRGLKGQYLDQINEMVTEFGKLGVVERRDGVKDDPDFPPVMFVESKPEFEEDVPDDRNTIGIAQCSIDTNAAGPRARFGRGVGILQATAAKEFVSDHAKRSAGGMTRCTA